MKEVSAPRNTTKAHIHLERRQGATLLVKDYSKRNILLRALYGRPMLKKEARVYKRLGGIQGVPICYGLDGRDRLLLQYIPSRTLGSFKRGELPDAVFNKLAGLIERIHAHGVAIGDLHRSNILITGQGDVFIVDYERALNMPDSGPGRFLAGLLMNLDRHALARLKARNGRLQKPSPQGLLGFLYSTGRLLKKTRKLVKKKCGT